MKDWEKASLIHSTLSGTIDVEVLVKKLRIRDGDVLCFRQDPGRDARTLVSFLDDLDRQLKEMGYHRVLLIGLDSADEVEILDERRMAEYGWYRRKSLSREDLHG